MIDKTLTLSAWPFGIHFKPWEIRREKDAWLDIYEIWGQYWVNGIETLNLLEATRRIVSIKAGSECTMHLVSFGRSKQHNKNVGGKDNSLHLQLKAADPFALTADKKIVPAVDLAMAAWAAGFRRVHVIPIGRAITVHMDTGRDPRAKFQAGGFIPNIPKEEYDVLNWYKRAA